MINVLPVLLAVGLFTTTSALATSYNCGIWLDDNESPSAQFAFDSAGPNAGSTAGNFSGLVGKQDDGSLIVMTGSSDKSVAAGLYQDGTSMILAYLGATDGHRAVTGCVVADKKLVKPSINFRK